MALRLAFAVAALGFTAALSARLLITLLALSQGASAATVGLLASTLALVPLAMSYAIGRMADRFGARWLLFTSAVMVGVGMSIPIFVPGIEALAVSALLSGAAFAFLAVVIQNLIGVLSRPEDRTRNFSSYALTTGTGMLVAPLVSGPLIEYGGNTVACAWAVVLATLMGGLLALFGGVFPGGQEKMNSDDEQPPAPAAPILRSLVVSCCVQLSIDLYQFVIPLYGHANGLSAATIGLVLGAFSTASFVVRVMMPKLVARVGEQRLLSTTFWLAAATFLALPASTNAWVLAGISFVFGLCMGCSLPLSILMMFAQAPKGRTARTLGLRLTVNNSARVLAPGVFGGIGAAFGLGPIFVISAAVMSLGGWLSRPGTPLKF